MKTTVFTAADYVDVYAGKLMIVGTFDNIMAEKCPITFKPFGVAVKMLLEAHDKGKVFAGRLTLANAKTKKLVFKLNIRTQLDVVSREKVNSIAMAFNLGGVRFDSFGEYQLDLRLGSRLRASTRLNVVKAKPSEKNKETRPSFVRMLSPQNTPR